MGRRGLALLCGAAWLCTGPPLARAQKNGGEAGGNPRLALASVDGGVEAAIDAPWRLEPDLASPLRYPVIPIVVSIHDANLQRDPETALSLGQFCELAIREDSSIGGPGTTVYRLAASVNEVERSDGWPPSSDVAANQRRCRPAAGESCTMELNVGTSGEWNATVLYVPQTQTPGADVRLTVQARVTTAGVPCGGARPINNDFPPFDRLRPVPINPPFGDPHSFIVVNRLSVHLGEEPLPRFGDGWAYGDLHYHSQGTDNEGESAYAYRPTLQAMRAIGLDFAFATEHASDSIQTTDIDLVYLRNIDLPWWVPFGSDLEDLIESIPVALETSANAARDMNPQRYATLLGGLNDADGANAQVMKFSGRRGPARLFLGGEVDVIPEMSPAERSAGKIGYGNLKTYSWVNACTPEGFSYLDYIRDYTSSELCDTPWKLAVAASEGGRYLVKDLQGLSDSYYARQHLIHLPVDPDRADSFVSSGTSLFGGATRRLGPATAASGEEDILQSVLYRDYAVEQRGYAFLAHPVAFDAGDGVGRLGPDIVPYSEVQLKAAFQSPSVLGLQLWNEDARLRSSQYYSFTGAGFPLQHMDGGAPGTSRWLWSRWQGMDPPRDAPRAYGALHHGMVAWDKMLLWGLRESQTQGLSWLPAGEPRRVFIAGGSDAHGDWNYRREGSVNGMAAATDTAIGKPRNLVNVGVERPETVTDGFGIPYGAVGQQQVTSALARGEFAVTDGPALRIVLDADADFVLDEDDIPMGGVSRAPTRGAYVPFFVEWKSTDEFGPIESIDLYVGVANDTREVAVVYAPPNHGVRSSEAPSGAVTPNPLIDAQGGSHPELWDRYLADPTGRLRIVPAAGEAKAGRRRVLLRANDFPVGRRRVILPREAECRLVPPHCNPAQMGCDEVCTDPVPGEWHFDALSVPDRWYVRGFARTVKPAGALCAQTGAGQSLDAYVAQTSGRCVERLAFTNPIWVDNTAVPPPPPDFAITCAPSAVPASAGGSATLGCTIRSLNGFASPVALSCLNLASGVGCSFSPSTVTPPANGSVDARLTVSVGLGVAPGSYLVRPHGRVGIVGHGTSVTLQVGPPVGRE